MSTYVESQWGWPEHAADLLALQVRLAAAADTVRPWRWPGRGTVAGCFVAFAPGQAGPGHAGDHAWAAATTCRIADGRPDAITTSVVVEGDVPAAYAPGLLALREGPLLARVIGRLSPRPDIVLVDATGRDHPRRAGLALHLGAALDVPTLGVTHRSLVAAAAEPDGARGAWTPLVLDGVTVGVRLRTRAGVHPVTVHLGWRTLISDAVAIVLAASRPSARTPRPLQAARAAARSARASATKYGAGGSPAPRQLRTSPSSATTVADNVR